MTEVDQVTRHPFLAPDMVSRWRAQCPSFTKLPLRDRAVVYRQGEPCRHIHYVVSGHAKLVSTDRDGHGLIRAMLHSGDFFGAIPGHARRPTQHAAICKGPVQLYRCEATQFTALLDAQADIARYLLINLGSQLLFARRQTEAVLHHSAKARLALMLHQLAGRYGGHCRHGHEIDVRLTQQELADLIGASRPVVSTILNELRQQRIVDYTRAFICIESMAALEKLVD